MSFSAVMAPEKFNSRPKETSDHMRAWCCNSDSVQPMLSFCLYHYRGTNVTVVTIRGSRTRWGTHWLTGLFLLPKGCFECD